MSEIKDFRSRFGFSTTPFTRELPVQDRFRVSANEQTLHHLARAVEERMSAALIAPSGSGKTLLLRALLDKLPESRYRHTYLKVVDLSKRDFCRELSRALDLEPAGNYPTLVRRLQERLSQSYYQEGMRWVIIVDEAHDFRPDVLGILRILTNFKMDSCLVVSLILAGRPALANRLNRNELRDVAERLAHRGCLELLSVTDSEQYVRHRCAIAGVQQAPFDADAITVLYELCRGNMRATDQLALQSLMVAHDADAARVNANHVTTARGML